MVTGSRIRVWTALGQGILLPIMNTINHIMILQVMLVYIKITAASELPFLEHLQLTERKLGASVHFLNNAHTTRLIL